MSVLRARGQRPHVPHDTPKPRRKSRRDDQGQLRLFDPGRGKPAPKYQSASEWPSWTDERVYTAYVDPDLWPDVSKEGGGLVALAEFTLPMSEVVSLHFAATQYPTDGPPEGGAR